jgi:hypothetical protein
MIQSGLSSQLQVRCLEQPIVELTTRQLGRKPMVARYLDQQGTHAGTLKVLDSFVDGFLVGGALDGSHN